MSSKITLKQMAEKLGVSVSTVSKALNNSHEIGDETKKKVLEFATLNNYKPNILARNLKNKKTNTIGVIIPNILNPFFAKAFSGIEKQANAMGYNIITAISNESLEKEKQIMDILNNGIIDGFILSVAEETQKEQSYNHIKQIMQSGTPVVIFDRVADGLNCDKVVVDDFNSAKYATEYLIKNGAKKIALLSTINNLSVGKLRFMGYKEITDEENNLFNEKLCIVEDQLDMFDKKLEKLLKSEKIDAVFALDEHASAMAIKMALKAGYKIPKELMVIGFADGVWSKRLTPSLSTISQHAPEIGSKAAQLLIEKLNKKNTETRLPQTIVVKTELRHRDSTKR